MTDPVRFKRMGKTVNVTKLLYFGAESNYLVEIDLHKTKCLPDLLSKNHLVYNTIYGKLLLYSTNTVKPNDLLKKTFGLNMHTHAFLLPCNYSAYQCIKHLTSNFSLENRSGPNK